jgi:hypothetical protein
MSDHEHLSDDMFGRYPEASFDDPEHVAFIVEGIEQQFASDVELRAETYERGLHKFAFGPEVDDEFPTRHPLLAVAMYRGIVASIEGVREEEREFTLNYELISTLQVCTDGPPEGRNYRAALDLVRELFPVADRAPTDGMNTYEDLWIAYNSLNEEKTAVLPGAVEVFSDLIRYELAAIRAGKSIVEMHEIGDERVVASDDAEKTVEELREAGATDVISVDNGDGTLTQFYGTGEYDYRIAIMEYATQARSVSPDLDIASLVIEHPEFLALPEAAQVRVLKGFMSDAEESGQPNLIPELFGHAAKHVPQLGSILQWELGQ